MSLVFNLAFIFILISLPPLLFIGFLYIASKKINLSFKIVGYLKFREIMILYDSDFLYLNIKLDQFQIYLIWLRIRIFIEGLTINAVIKNKSLSYIKSKPVNKADFVESFVLKKNTNPQRNVQGGGKRNSTNFNENSSFQTNQYLDQPEFLRTIKEKFYQIIKEKYMTRHINSNQEGRIEEEVIDNILKKSEISRTDKILRNLITFFDILLENTQVNFKLSEMNMYHHLYIRKAIIGAVKGINKVRILLIFYK